MIAIAVATSGQAPAQQPASPRFKAEAERAAVNHPVQGFAADLMKLAMVGVKAKFEARGISREEVALTLSIHDELLFEVRDSMIEEIIPLVREAMERVYPLSVPLRVDVSVGKDLGNLTKRT